ncbi:MAG: flagellar basal body protein [Xanthomonadaceae bacterium]|nr:flagellar basal body protein [Xanthomonadaceae bacterium]
MSSMSAIALSGIQAGLTRLAVSANNIANASSDGFTPQRVVQSAHPGGGTTVQAVQDPSGGSLLEDQVQQLSARYAIEANVLSLRTEFETLGRLLDRRA